MNVLLVESEMSDCTIVLKDGTTIDVNSQDLFRKDLHHFKGWTCTAGTDSILIESDFQVWSGVCRNDNLGNLFDDNFDLFQSPTVCTRNQCTTCESDLLNTKKRN
jgi:hypothetical protein